MASLLRRIRLLEIKINIYCRLPAGKNAQLPVLGAGVNQVALSVFLLCIQNFGRQM